MTADINPSKTADAPIHDLLSKRYSPYLFEAKAVESEKLATCLDAARWAASSFNEQPWRFIVATRDDSAAFATLLDCLVEANQSWAKNAGVLILTVAKLTFTRNNTPNRVAEHDIGMASANLVVQATALGLHAHQMAGIDMSKCRHTYGIPEGYDPVTAIALGYAADPAGRDDDMAKRDQGARQRKPFDEWVFAGKWEQSAGI